MPSHRNLRVAEAIRKVVATAILVELADPRVRAVTVVRVEVSGDLRYATVFVSIMGSESERNRSLKGLEHSRGFIQARIANSLQTRFTPILAFKYDHSVGKSAELGRLIDVAVASDQRTRNEPVDLSGASRDERVPADSTVRQEVQLADSQNV